MTKPFKEQVTEIQLSDVLPLGSVKQVGNLAIGPTSFMSTINTKNVPIPGGNSPEAPDTGGQDTPFETSNDSSKETSFGKSDIDALQHKASELSGIADVEQGLERAIIGAGLQTLAKEFGADKLLEAMLDHGSWTLQKVVKMLVPEKGKRVKLYEQIKNEPMSGLKQRLNDTLGGVSYSYGCLEAFRGAEISSISGRPTFHGNHPVTNKDGITESGSLLLGGDLHSLFKNHPELADRFRESNDTLVLLKGVRELYGAEYTQFTANLERAQAEVHKQVAVGEAGFTELNALADSIYGDELARLNEILASTSDVDAQALIQSILDKRLAEVAATTEELDAKMKAAREKIILDLGADRLTKLHVYELPKPELIDLSVVKRGA